MAGRPKGARNKKKDVDMTSQPAKYFLARQEGMNKNEAQIRAGYLTTKNAHRIERTKDYQEVKEYYKDKLLEKITMEDIAKEQVKVIVQDENLNAKNRAIEMALDKIEPVEKVKGNDDDEITMVILRG